MVTLLPGKTLRVERFTRRRFKAATSGSDYSDRKDAVELPWLSVRRKSRDCANLPSSKNHLLLDGALRQCGETRTGMRRLQHYQEQPRSKGILTRQRGIRASIPSRTNRLWHSFIREPTRKHGVVAVPISLHGVGYSRSYEGHRGTRGREAIRREHICRFGAFSLICHDKDPRLMSGILPSWWGLNQGLH